MCVIYRTSHVIQISVKTTLTVGIKYFTRKGFGKYIKDIPPSRNTVEIFLALSGKL